MANWQLTAGLQNLRDQVNERWPTRDHESDGSIGDTAHQAETSGHNRDDTAGSRPAWDGDPDNLPEVRAWDMDTDLREPGTTALQVVDHIRRLPGVAGVLRYMIYDRRMYHSRDNFGPSAYNGPSAHTEHIHFEGAFSQAADNNTSFDYRLWEINMPTPKEFGDAAAEGVARWFAAAYHAAVADDAYNNASEDEKRAMRNNRNILQGILGGPVNQATILAAVAGVDEAVMAKISDPSTPDEQVADALVSLLGARKDAVLALMR